MKKGLTSGRQYQNEVCLTISKKVVEQKIFLFNHFFVRFCYSFYEIASKFLSTKLIDNTASHTIARVTGGIGYVVVSFLVNDKRRAAFL